MGSRRALVVRRSRIWPPYVPHVKDGRTAADGPQRPINPVFQTETARPRLFASVPWPPNRRVAGPVWKS